MTDTLFDEGLGISQSLFQEVQLPLLRIILVGTADARNNRLTSFELSPDIQDIKTLGRSATYWSMMGLRLRTCRISVMNEDYGGRRPRLNLSANITHECL